MKKTLALTVLLVLCGTLLLGGCSPAGKPRLDPKNPVTLEVWHYYNGPQKLAFDALVAQFNETVGLETGILVEPYSPGNLNALIENVLASANQAVGAKPLPAIFACYADTALEVDHLGLLADLNSYFSPQELSAYRSEFLEEGQFSGDGSLSIFPVAKSVELLMLNLTDWNRFAAETGAQLSTLETMEGVVDTARVYYQWTDEQTPQPDDGKAFFGRDAMANYMIIGCRQLGDEIFQVEGDTVTLHADPTALRTLWDNYYVPYIHGWFSANGRFRSEEANLGDIIALVGSSSATSFFPDEVTKTDLNRYPISCAILPAPRFAQGASFAIQQGAGMAVTKSTPTQEYASAVFLKWFTAPEQNIAFATASGGYLPVTNEALDAERIGAALAQRYTEGEQLDRMEQTFAAGLEQLSSYTMYTPPAFDGGIDARAVLADSLDQWAKEDRQSILAQVEQGIPAQEAIAQFDTDQRFDAWMQQLVHGLSQAIP